jgi:hypothetical protein
MYNPPPHLKRPMMKVVDFKKKVDRKIIKDSYGPLANHPDKPIPGSRKLPPGMMAERDRVSELSDRLEQAFSALNKMNEYIIDLHQVVNDQEKELVQMNERVSFLTRSLLKLTEFVGYTGE